MIDDDYKNKAIIRKCKIEEEIGLMRLDKYISRRFSYYSRARWKSIIEKKLVFINDKVVNYRKLIKKGDEITYHLIDIKEPKVNRNVEIIYDDGDLIIVNKPANLPVIPSGRYYYNTLHTIMSEKLNMSVKMLNRIDRETSGCVVLSRSHEMASKFSNMIKNNSIKKMYLAIVETNENEDLNNNKNIEEGKKFTVTGNMIESGSPHFRRYQVFTKHGGKFSKTIFKTKKISGNKAILLARLYTGRMHQIRVHLKESGLFMVGDKIYGKHGAKIFDDFTKHDDYQVPSDMFERQALHAYKLIFKHPFTNKEIVIKAPLPSDLKKYIKDNFI